MRGALIKHKIKLSYGYFLQIKTFARELQSRYNHAQISSIGTTHEGRPIEMVTASLNDGARRAGIVIDCGVHAREWVSPSFCMYALEQLLRGGKGRFTCDVCRGYPKSRHSKLLMGNGVQLFEISVDIT